MLLFKVSPALLTDWIGIKQHRLVRDRRRADPGHDLRPLPLADLALPDLRRVFQYHAAEHKAINAYEAGDELTPELVQRYRLIHPRCGTAFLLWVMVIAIFVFAFFGRPAWYWLIATRILLLPVIAGLAYELIRFAGKHQSNRVLMTLLAPGLWLQRLTTREPSLDQIEVSIRALKEVLSLEAQNADRAQDRSDGLACRRVQREANVTWSGQPRPRQRLDHRGDRRVRRAAVLARDAGRASRRQDEPGGTARRRARRLFRDVARGRADERGLAAGAARRHRDGDVDEVDGGSHQIVSSELLARARVTGQRRRGLPAARGSSERRLSVLRLDRGEREGNRDRTTRRRAQMATDRKAQVTWHGDLMSGSGTVDSVTSGAFGGLDVSWAARAEEPGGKTSPEELIAAAHAACLRWRSRTGLRRPVMRPRS